MNVLFMYCVGVSSVKWSASGVLHNGLGKSVLGSLTYFKRASDPGSRDT